MKRFVFRLESVLKLRRLQRDLSQKRLSEAMQLDEQLLAPRKQVEASRALQLEQMRSMGGAGEMDVDAASTRRYFATQLIGDVAQIEQQRYVLSKHIAKCRSEVVLADQAVRALEKLEEKQRAEFTFEQECRTQRELEETWQATQTGGRP